jgi:hypothetical protein
MTHFILEIHTKETKSMISRYKGFFQEKFRSSKYLLGSKYGLIVGDFTEMNFYVEDSDEILLLETNLIQNMNIEDNKQKANTKQSALNASVIYDKKTQKILINSDPFGLDYYYIAATDHGFIISSHLKYIISLDPKLLNSLDYDAVIEFLYSHVILGSKTFFSKIKLLPYNCKIDIRDWERDSLNALFKSLENKENWFSFPNNYNFNVDASDKSIELSTKLNKIISSLFTIENPEVHFFLSGGLDSRVLITSIDEENLPNCSALTFDSSSKGFEMEKAKRVVDILKVKHKTKIVTPEFVVSNSFRYMWMTEGLANHVVSTLLDLIESIENPPLFFVDGFVGDAQFGGEFLRNLDKIVRSTDNPISRISKMMKYHDYVFPEREFYSLIKNSRNKIDRIIHKGLQEEIDLFWETKNPTQESETLLALIRGRGYTIGGPRTSDNFGITIMPFYHPQVFSSYIQAPPDLRANRNLEIQTLAHLNSKMISEKSTSQKWYKKLRLTRYGLKFLQFLEGIFNRKIVPSYSSVPYFEWMRSNIMYRSFIEDLIYNNKALIWNIIDSSATQKLFKRFMNRKNHDHKFLLHVIDLEIILQLFYSLKADSEPSIIRSDTLDFQKEMKIDIVLDAHKKITKSI